jgi:hypothetical protein
VPDVRTRPADPRRLDLRRNRKAPLFLALAIAFGTVAAGCEGDDTVVEEDENGGGETTEDEGGDGETTEDEGGDGGGEDSGDGGGDDSDVDVDVG